MNNDLLHPKVQEYINDHINADVNVILLKGIPFECIDKKTLIAQIQAKKKALKKLPTWYKTKNILYPKPLHIEQTSSEITAAYKAQVFNGERCIDITGGFGVDTYYFSRGFKHVSYCEINTELYQAVNHNFKQLAVENITTYNQSGIEVLKTLNTTWDCIYLDPSRRDATQNKVFLLSDCTPNAKTFQGLFLKFAKRVVIKTSPLLDITQTLTDLKHVTQLHIVAVNNEVKELLWVLQHTETSTTIKISTVNINHTATQQFNFNWADSKTAKAKYSLPLEYLYEPNAAVLKSGAFQLISETLQINKLHQHSHLYTSERLLEFPGRRFKIQQTLPFNKKIFSKLKLKKANVTTRNFPISVQNIRKKLGLKDGGVCYLFFSTNLNNEKIILVCQKV